MVRFFLIGVLLFYPLGLKAQEGIIISVQEIDELVSQTHTKPTANIQVDIYVGALDEKYPQPDIITTSYQMNPHTPVSKTDILYHLQATDGFVKLLQQHPHIPMFFMVEAYVLGEEQSLQKKDVLTEFQIQRYGNFEEK